ncbi:MAG: hypothetical protein RXR70_04345 [Acidilobus sp.]
MPSLRGLGGDWSHAPSSQRALVTVDGGPRAVGLTAAYDVLAMPLSPVEM